MTYVIVLHTCSIARRTWWLMWKAPVSWNLLEVGLKKLDFLGKLWQCFEMMLHPLEVLSIRPCWQRTTWSWDIWGCLRLDARPSWLGVLSQQVPIWLEFHDLLDWIVNPIFKNSHKPVKIQRNANPTGMFLFSVQVLRKNHKLAIQQYLKKNLHKIDYLVWRFMTFKPN